MTRKKLLPRIFAIFFIALILASVIGVATLAQLSGKEARRQLELETQYLSALLKLNNDPAAYTHLFEDRITLIGHDGKVLYDSAVPAYSMDNHALRPEVRAALTTGRGRASRLSATLGQETHYYALLLDDGKVLRLTRKGLSVFGSLALFSYWIVPIIACILLAVFLLRERERSQKLRREFSANVSHELKTPLTSIMGYAEIISNGIAYAEDVPRFAGQIHREAARLFNLIECIIKLSRLDELGEAEFRTAFEELNFEDLCRNVLNELEYKACQYKVSLSLARTGESAVLWGIPYTLHDMVYNLVDNAIIYNKENGSVTLALHVEQDRITLIVKDTGIGISAEHHERVFERFYRVDKSRSKESSGTGLGLSIVRHAAELHNGTITLASIPGEGTELTVSLKKTRHVMLNRNNMA
ncbi:MAG: hypothetical protein LBD22_04445 [Spirochaetaceae bacterium]|jgi:two-component system phosphate regulon sensor histidine kinase PhoR|nr:hypothetical protein [Spirochaetaceae bacterium]